MMAAVGRCLALFTVVAPLLPLVCGHGRLMEPPSRSSMWRQGYASPVNYADNQLFCGGFKHQWEEQGGRCGVCGDPYDGPRHHEPGGKYYTGIITRTYITGEAIDVHVHLTAFHYGYFEFRLCQLEYRNQTVGQDCFDRHQLRLVTPSESQVATRYKLPDDPSITLVKLQVRLPSHVTCDQCVLQWKYHAANSWGKEPSGRTCIGCGPQEEFYGCADVTIHPPGGAPSGQVFSKRTEVKGTSDSAVNQVLKRTASEESDYSAEDDVPSIQQDDWSGPWAVASDPWYGDRPGAEQGTPPEPKSMAALKDMKAVLVGKCHATGAWRGQAAMDDWCEVNCDQGHCPDTHCACGDGQGAGGGKVRDRATGGSTNRQAGNYKPEPLPEVTPVQRWSPLAKIGGNSGSSSSSPTSRALPYRIVTQQALPWIPDPKAAQPRQPAYTPRTQRTYRRSRDRGFTGGATRGSQSGSYWGNTGGPQDKPNYWGTKGGPENKPNKWGTNSGPQSKPTNWGSSQSLKDKSWDPWSAPSGADQRGLGYGDYGPPGGQGYAPPAPSNGVRRGQQGVGDVVDYSQTAFHGLKHQAEAAYRSVIGKERKKRPGLFDHYKTFGAPHLSMDSMSWSQFNLDRPLYTADGFGLNARRQRKTSRTYSPWKANPKPETLFSKSGFPAYPSAKESPYSFGGSSYSGPSASFGYGFGGPDRRRGDANLIKQAQFVDGSPGGARAQRRPEPKRVAPLDTERGELGDNCEASGAWKGQVSMTKWCQGNCPLGNCPPTHCKCTY